MTLGNDIRNTPEKGKSTILLWMTVSWHQARSRGIKMYDRNHLQKPCMPFQQRLHTVSHWTVSPKFLRLRATVVFQLSLLWSFQPCKTTGTCLGAEVIERSSRKDILITKSTPSSVVYLAYTGGFDVLGCTSKRTTGESWQSVQAQRQKKSVHAYM